MVGHGGGVLVYVAEHLVFQHRLEYQSEFYEHVWVDVKINSKTFAINALYRPPSENLIDYQYFLDTDFNEPRMIFKPLKS